MSYKTCYAQRLNNNDYLIHLWTDEGYHKYNWSYYAYEECSEDESDSNIRGLKHETLKKVRNWHKDNPKLHFHDMKPYQRFLIDRFRDNDEPSTSHKEIFFDIEIEMGGALTKEYIESAPKPVTSIAWWYKQEDIWEILLLDPKQEIESYKQNNIRIHSFKSESELLLFFLERLRKIQPNILIGYNSDYFDIPYLYFRMCKIFDKEVASMLSPINRIINESEYSDHRWITIAGIESLDYMKLHKKYSWKDEPSYSLDYVGKKYVKMGKIKYDGSLDRLFKENKTKFIEYNFRDVEIIKKLDEKFQYISITKNLAHKGKINYSDVYKSSLIHDGAISSYLLNQNIIPPSRDRNPITKENYAGGFLFCPKAGIYKYMFDEDLTSLYPAIIMSLNIGKETYVGRILIDDEKVLVGKAIVKGKKTDKYIYNCRYGLSDLKQMDPDRILTIQNSKRKNSQITVRDLIDVIHKNKLTISANGVMYRTNFDSVFKTILNLWFNERVLYKNKMKAAYKAGNKEEGEKYHLLQYTIKILLNSLYGATSLSSFRYGNVIMSESITLSGQRIIQESATFINKHINKVIKNQIQLT
jgi:DNA polymerase elongation subunit (family B)